MAQKLCLIIPCFQNEKNIPHTGKALCALKDQLKNIIELEVTLVDDGSVDKTYEELCIFQKDQASWVRVIKLTRNFGSSNAVMAGLKASEGNCYAFMSADLQDPPELIAKMTEYWLKGIKLVIANRKDRPEGFFQRTISNTYHFLIRKYGVPSAPPGGFDLLLFDREIRDLLVSQNEQNAYLPYLISWYGYHYVNIPYERRARVHGKSSWSFGKKVKAFIDSFVAFSYMPIRLISSAGFLVGTIGMIYLIAILAVKLVYGIPIQGWTSLMAVIVFLGSMQLVSIGILGEYLWRSLDASRKRPTYIVDRIHEIN